jgi:uncharacterized protein
MGMLPEIAKHLPRLRELCQEYQVQELSLFGSALRPDFRPESDLDFLVEFRPEAQIGLFRFAHMQHELEDLFQRRVDLVPKKGLRPFLKDSVLGSAQTVYARG